MKHAYQLGAACQNAGMKKPHPVKGAAGFSAYSGLIFRGLPRGLDPGLAGAEPLARLAAFRAGVLMLPRSLPMFSGWLQWGQFILLG